MKTQPIVTVYQILHELKAVPCAAALVTKDLFFFQDCLDRYIQACYRLLGPSLQVHRCSASEILEEDLQSSLFPALKLFVVQCDRIKKNEALIEHLSCAQPSNHFLLCSMDTIPPDLVDWVDGCGFGLWIETLKPWEKVPFIVKWIKGFCQKQHHTIDEQGAYALATCYSDNREGLVHELHKLITYKYQQAIHYEDVEAICWIAESSTMWQLLDGLIYGDMQAIAKAFDPEWNEFALLRFIRNQLERLIIAVEQGGNAKTKTQQKQFDRIRHLGVSQLVSWMIAISLKEVSLRSGETDFAAVPFFLSLLRSKR